MTGRFDLIVAAHLLGELFVDEPPDERIDARARRVRAWVDGLLAPGGTVILVEPALRETSRELLAVRDQLLALSDLEIVAPCFWTGACPALARERDWCHDAVEVAGSPRVDFSYLVLRDRWRPIPGQLRYRVVSDPMPEKGRLKLYACGPTGRHAYIRLDRHEVARQRRVRRSRPWRRRPHRRRHAGQRRHARRGDDRRRARARRTPP